MASSNSRLMKLFWLIEDGADDEAVLSFLKRTGSGRSFKRREDREERRDSDEPRQGRMN
jgi:hypothetical protein